MSNVAAVRANPSWTRRRHAAEVYRPKTIRLLLIAEGPPENLSRYFYFEDDASDDPLLREVCDVLFEGAPPADKRARLKELKRRGVFLIELRPDAPLGDAKPSEYAEWLALRLEELRPEQIVLVHPAAYDAARKKLASAKWPVSDVRVPAPTNGREVEFRREFRTALIRAELEKLIRPLPSGAKSKRAPKAVSEAVGEPAKAEERTVAAPEAVPPRASKTRGKPAPASRTKRASRPKPKRSH